MSDSLVSCVSMGQRALAKWMKLHTQSCNRKLKQSSVLEEPMGRTTVWKAATAMLMLMLEGMVVKVPAVLVVVREEEEVELEAQGRLPTMEGGEGDVEMGVVEAHRHRLARGGGEVGAAAEGGGRRAVGADRIVEAVARTMSRSPRQMEPSLGRADSLMGGRR